LSAHNGVDAEPGLLQSRIVRAILLLFPTAVVFGPLASIPYNSGGWGSLYRLLYIPAAVIFFLVWKHHGRPLFVGMRSMLIFTGLAALVGTFMVLVLRNDAERGAADHYILIVSLVIAWLAAAAISCDQTVRNLLLSGWYVAYLIAAFMAVMHLLGLFIPPTAFGLLASQYLAGGFASIGYSGILGTANDMGSFALAAAPVAYLATRNWENRRWRYLLFVAAITMVVLSGSRAAVAGMLLLSLVYLTLRRSNTPGRVSIVLIVAAYAAVLSWFLYTVLLRSWLTAVPYLGPVLAEAEGGFNVGDSNRLTTWGYLVELTRDQFPFGVGPGQFEELVYALMFALNTNAHNVFLEVSFEYGGLVGAAGLVWLGVVAYYSVQRARRATTDEDNIVVSAGATVLFGLVLWGLVTSTLITRPQWPLLLGTGLGLVSSVVMSRAATGNTAAKVTTDSSAVPAEPSVPGHPDSGRSTTQSQTRSTTSV
jgi:hypothetical protein